MVVLKVETSCPKVSTVMLVLGATDEMTSCPKVVETNCPKVSTVMLVLRATDEMTSCPMTILPAVEGQNAEIHRRGASIRLVLVGTIQQDTVLL
jgi:hypothetical protein